MKAAGDVGDHGGIERQRAVLNDVPSLSTSWRGLGAKLMHQNLDTRLVDVVAAAELIVRPQHRLE